MRLLVCFIVIVSARLQFDCWPFELFEVQSCSNSRYFVRATVSLGVESSPPTLDEQGGTDVVQTRTGRSMSLDMFDSRRTRR